VLSLVLRHGTRKNYVLLLRSIQDHSILRVSRRPVTGIEEHQPKASDLLRGPLERLEEAAQLLIAESPRPLLFGKRLVEADERGVLISRRRIAP
jgi:hypothetical protein